MKIKKYIFCKVEILEETNAKCIAIKSSLIVVFIYMLPYFLYTLLYILKEMCHWLHMNFKRRKLNEWNENLLSKIDNFHITFGKKKVFEWDIQMIFHATALIENYNELKKDTKHMQKWWMMVGKKSSCLSEKE